MWQEIIVGIIVAAAALHAARKYLPAAWRQQIVYALSRRGLSQEKLARFFNTESSCGSGCGSCGGCGDAPAPSAPAAPPSDGGPARRVIRIYTSSKA
ncbi:hypothetical protein SAMN05518865_111190 [Duganella sp. CF458]|uniref:DUF6587 family protein n=1 Tax=Duganella sp. CF458 TaxID=1884368 RepID=UPI0008EBCB53|nr:DUF6587 family protein [Duganella sp. CF458]SFG38933.1 hypothetical protein SAMN05518865_111190 [Duganella sp. CF458]